MYFNEDDRAQRVFDIIENIREQINISYVNSCNHIVAWHKHNIQTDFWFCVKGSFKVGLAFPVKMENGIKYDVKWEFISDKNFRTIEIPPGVFHGYKALEPNSILLYFLTNKYDVTDEEKVLPGFFGEVWEVENK